MKVQLKESEIEIKLKLKEEKNKRKTEAWGEGHWMKANQFKRI